MEIPMFKIIISELEYFKYFFSFIFGLILLFFIGAIKFEELDLYSFMSNSSIIFFISVGIFGGSSDKEKRERYHTLLPFSVKTLGKQRLLFIILYQAFVFLLWLVLYFVKYFPENSKLIWPLISIVMFNLIILCFFVIYTDLSFWGIKFHKPMIALIIAFSIFLYSMTILNLEVYVFSELNFNTQLFSAYIDFIKLPYGAIFMTVLAASLYYLSYVIFINRKSYLA
jgi:hypothetical protein